MDNQKLWWTTRNCNLVARETTTSFFLIWTLIPSTTTYLLLRRLPDQWHLSSRLPSDNNMYLLWSSPQQINSTVWDKRINNVCQFSYFLTIVMQTHKCQNKPVSRAIWALGIKNLRPSTLLAGQICFPNRDFGFIKTEGWPPVVSGT